MNKLRRIRRYKYLSFSENSLRIIKSGTIKFTKPSEFNDPFDCDPEHETNVDSLLKNRPDLVKKAAQFLNLSKEQLIIEKPIMAERVKKAIEAGYFGQPASDNVGICSLSRDPLNLLMWAHYSKDHTGFVVEFDIPIESFDLPEKDVGYFEKLIPHKVHYQDSKPMVSFLDDNDVKMTKQFLTKGSVWKYEQEERVIDYIRKSGIHVYDQKNILFSVIAGMRMKDPELSKLEDAVKTINKEKGLNISFYKATPLKGKFGLVIKERPELTSQYNLQ